jgi:uncharacterized protein (DUF488 family)
MLVTDQPPGRTGLIGIGYQGCELGPFLAGLARDGVGVVADVRLTPVSRKRGFSKRALAEALADAGIEYRHLPVLGNPKHNRAGFAGTEVELMEARRRYAAGLLTHQATETLALITQLAAVRRVALLCFEADQRRCHRDVIAAAIADPAAFAIPQEA